MSSNNKNSKKNRKNNKGRQNKDVTDSRNAIALAALTKTQAGFMANNYKQERRGPTRRSQRNAEIQRSYNEN